MACRRRSTRPGAAKAGYVVAVAACLVGLLVGCGDDETAGSSTTSESTTTESSGSTSSGSASTSTSAAAGTTSAPTTAASAATTTAGSATTLPGDDFPGFVQSGDVLGVIGVAHDDVLNIREGPGADTAAIASAGPTAADLVATGRSRSLPQSIWYEVTVDGVTGWARARFLGFIDGTDDVTARYLADVGERPAAETMTQLGELVAAEFATEDPVSRIVLTVAPSIGDLAEVTYDVIGIGDDATRGYRVHIFATETESGEGFELRTIELTTLCDRGSTGETCV